MTTAALRLRDFELGYSTAPGTRMILEDVNLELPAGELVLFVGPSGSGKSSLLAAILGFDDPFAPRAHIRGDLKVLGEPVAGTLSPKLRGRVAILFQDGALIDELSPRGNVTLALRESARPTRATADELLQRVGLPHPPATVAALSGGQRKRVGLARTLAVDPELLILDEPTAGLDPPGARAVAELIRDVHRGSDDRPHRTTLVVTHDLEAFEGIADNALFLDAARGRLELLPVTDAAQALRDADPKERAAAPPPVVPMSIPRRALRRGRNVLLAAASVLHVVVTSIRHIVPYHMGMLGRSLEDHLVRPALYLALAAATAGALATYFALATNPLEGGFRREVLMGNGKVLVSTALPLLIGILFAARSGAGAAARLGSLRRAQVFEALPLIGVSPPAFLLNPLLWGCVVGAVALTALGIVCGCLASLVITEATTAISSFGWATASFRAVEGSDLQWAFLKATGTGVITAVTAYSLAAKPKSSARDVAEATNASIVWGTLWVLLLHGSLTVVQYA